MSEALALRHALEEARERILQAESAEETRRWCRWIMKRLVAAGRRLAGSEARFATRYPRHAPFLYEAKRRAEEPSDHVGRLLPFLKFFGRWLVRETERRFGGGGADALPCWKRLPPGKDRACDRA